MSRQRTITPAGLQAETDKRPPKQPTAKQAEAAFGPAVETGSSIGNEERVPVLKQRTASEAVQELNILRASGGREPVTLAGLRNEGSAVWALLLPVGWVQMGRSVVPSTEEWKQFRQEAEEDA